MAKQRQTWPNWRIVALLVASAAACGVLGYLAFYLESLAAAGGGAEPGSPSAGVPLANMVLVFSAAGGLLALFCAGWLVQRWRDRFPTSNRRVKKKRRRR